MSHTSPQEEQDEIEIALQGIQSLPCEYILPYPFTVIDAALHQYLTEEQNRNRQAPRFKRRGYTSGSAHYILQERRQPINFATIEVRAAFESPAATTYIAITLTHPASAYINANHRIIIDFDCRRRLLLFKIWLHQDQERFLDIWGRTTDEAIEGFAEEASTATVNALIAKLERSKPKLGRGRPGSPNSAWAREEVIHGRPEQEVFADYLEREQRAGIDITNPTEKKKAWDRFRKAIA